MTDQLSRRRFAELVSLAAGWLTFPAIAADTVSRMRAPHIHFDVQGRVDRKVTQLFFPGEGLNDQDRHLRSVLHPEGLIARVSRSAAGPAELVAERDIILTTG